MSDTANKAWAWWTSVNARFGSFFLFFCIVASTFASVGVYVQSRTNAAQDAARAADQKERTEANSNLLACFDKFATDLSGSLPPVRDATAKRDAKRDLYDTAVLAALVGDKGLGGLLIRAQQGVKSDPKKDLAMLINTFDKVKRASVALDAATAELIKVRAANPYPPPPSKFCELP